LNGITPLCLASYLGKSDVVSVLIKEGGANVDATDSNGATPLMYAARDGHENIVQLLLEYGAKVDTVDCNAWSSLQYSRAYPGITRLLEEHLRKSRQ
ncbi:ankyrin, partial [Basidiobolus meristosporus CBS 931.73]